MNLTYEETKIISLAIDKLFDEGNKANRMSRDKIDLIPLHSLKDKIDTYLDNKTAEHFNNEINSVFQDKTYIGRCPLCNGNDGYVNIGKNHYSVCNTHKKYWYKGSNLFSTWMDENEQIWNQNREKLSEYELVE